MFFLSFLAIILGSVLILGITPMGFGRMFNFFDFNSFLVLLLITFPILISSGLLKDFQNSFRLVIGKKKGGSLTEIKKAKEAVDLVGKTLLYVGAFIAMFSMVIILGNIDDPNALGPSIAITVLSLLYALAINLILLPLKSKLKMMLIEFMHEEV